MIYPADERIMVSKSVHSIAVKNDISTPSYNFPNKQNMLVEKEFLTAGMQGLGCIGCAALGEVPTSIWGLIGVGFLAVMLLPAKYTRM